MTSLKRMLEECMSRKPCEICYLYGIDYHADMMGTITESYKVQVVFMLIYFVIVVTPIDFNGVEEKC
jgi:hypothetical protein